jgi:hypothetical protein
MRRVTMNPWPALRTLSRDERRRDNLLIGKSIVEISGLVKLLNFIRTLQAEEFIDWLNEVERVF